MYVGYIFFSASVLSSILLATLVKLFEMGPYVPAIYARMPAYPLLTPALRIPVTRPCMLPVVATLPANTRSAMHMIRPLVPRRSVFSSSVPVA